MTIQATFCATLVDEFVRGGVRWAVIAPGSRSAPIALALLAESRIETHVRLDERSAGFFALGIALESASPVVVVTTSGTATAELHAAVLEADLARVPLIVATADRPFELQGVGAPQVVNQRALYGDAVRFFADAGVPDIAAQSSWRSFASRLLAEAVHAPSGPGPVHVNLPFREPLVGAPDALPTGRPDDRPWHDVVTDGAVGSASLERFARATDGRRGVVIVGGPIGEGGSDAVTAFAAKAGWPVFADPRSVPRGAAGVVIAHPNGIVSAPPTLDILTPEVIVHVGSPHASKHLGTWCDALGDRGVPHVLIDPYGAFEDPDRNAALVLRVDPIALLSAATDTISAPADASWLTTWRSVDDAVERAIVDALGAAELPTEPGIARVLLSSTDERHVIFASSSMPVRDLEWFGATQSKPPTVLSNRGANGIDGVTSTALGVALASSQRGAGVVALMGDLAFLHDLSGLVFGRHEVVPDATIVVIDNGGGGIFSFLPYAEALDEGAFERAFGTPQRPSIAAIASALGHDTVQVTSLDGLARVVEKQPSGITVAVVHTDRAANVAFHSLLDARVAAAVRGALGP